MTKLILFCYILYPKWEGCIILNQWNQRILTMKINQFEIHSQNQVTILNKADIVVSTKTIFC